MRGAVDPHTFTCSDTNAERSMMGHGDMPSGIAGWKWLKVHTAVATSVSSPTMTHTRRSTDVRPRKSRRSESKYRYGLR